MLYLHSSLGTELESADGHEVTVDLGVVLELGHELGVGGEETGRENGVILSDQPGQLHATLAHLDNMDIQHTRYPPPPTHTWTWYIHATLPHLDTQHGHV
jgi:hypothetical protein